MAKIFFTKIIDDSFKIMEAILKLKPYTNREDVLRVAQAMAKMAKDNAKYSPSIKESYIEAFNKLQSLSFEEMMEIKNIIS